MEPSFPPAFAAMSASMSEASPVFGTMATTWSENLVLADCGIGRGPGGGSTSRQMMYYSGAAWGTPTYMAEVPWDGSYPWRTEGVSTTLPNGDRWTVNVVNDVGDPNWAGWAVHTYDKEPLYCWSRHIDGLYTLDDGTSCSMAFICTHNPDQPPGSPSSPPPPPPPPPPAPERPKISFNVRDETVELVGQHSARDILGLVEYSGSGAEYCADKAFTIPNSAKEYDPPLPDCTIRFECGPKNARAMAEVAKQVFDKNKDLWKQETQKLERCRVRNICSSPQSCVRSCEQQPDCKCESPYDRDVTRVPARVVIDKLDDAQSRFQYTITCPNYQNIKDCKLCRAARAGALVLNIFTAGLSTVMVETICAASNC